MRTAIEITADIRATNQELRRIDYSNVFGLTEEEAILQQVKQMKLQRQLFQLCAERDEWIKSNGDAE